MAISVRTDRKKPSVWRNGRRKTSRSVNAVSIAWSENLRGPPGRPDNPGVQAATASGESHSVTSPRCTRARSYAGFTMASNLNPEDAETGVRAVEGDTFDQTGQGFAIRGGDVAGHALHDA